MQPNNLKTNPFSKTAARQIISIQSASFGTWLLSEQTTKGAQQNWRTTCASENADLCTDFNVHSTQKSTCSASARPTFKMTGRPQIFGQTSIYTVHRNRFVLQARALPSKWPADPRVSRSIAFLVQILIYQQYAEIGFLRKSNKISGSSKCDLRQIRVKQIVAKLKFCENKFLKLDRFKKAAAAKFKITQTKVLKAAAVSQTAVSKFINFQN